MNFRPRFVKLPLKITAALALTGMLFADITLYNGQHKEATQALVEAFTKETGIKVNVNSGKDTELASKIKEEGDKTPADVIYVESTGALLSLANEGMLAKLAKSTVKATANPGVPVAKNQDWVAVSGRARVVVYDARKLSDKDMEKSVLDYATPKWKGRLGFAPTSGAFVAQIATIKKLKGEATAIKFLEGLKANGKVYPKNSVALQAVENGEIQAALINNYYWYARAKEVGEKNMHSKLYFVGNKDVGALMIYSGAAVLKASKHKNEAKKFVAFLVSKKGQETLTTARAEYPLRKNVKSGYKLPSYTTVGSPEVTLTQDDIDDANALIRKVGLI
ncbi:MAG: extracellular solute-binding protein [Helicobacter sp.]|nr:extracellular solute-binding protein [Helicobacter sp.]